VLEALHQKIILAATLSSLGTIPVAGMVLLLGVDRFMSEARAITNTIGNGVGTMAIAKWVGALDTAKMNRALNGEPEPLEVEVAPAAEDATGSNAKPATATAYAHHAAV
jgi:DAACS family dicarboxylate/amino acid:cation (Na+ or H+) symporter/aerobic C4-dicarboxylate transport protein